MCANNGICDISSSLFSPYVLLSSCLMFYYMFLASIAKRHTNVLINLLLPVTCYLFLNHIFFLFLTVILIYFTQTIVIFPQHLHYVWDIFLFLIAVGCKNN